MRKNKDINRNNIEVKKSIGKCFNIVTGVYPLFPTDMQPLFGVLLATNKGSCMVEETIFDNRMQIYEDLSKLGGFINVVENKVYIIGTTINNRVNIECKDLRHAAASLILLVKNGGKISNVELIYRGYDNVLKKLKRIGCKIEKNNFKN